jgi:NitT/TauT family transport system ATP-binding protein
LLGFAQVDQGDIQLTGAGEALAQAGIQGHNQLFATQVQERVPLIRHLRRVLARCPDHRAPKERFLRKLEDFMSSEDAKELLAIAIDWGRYAELFDYDYHAGILSLESPVDVSEIA